MSAGGTVTSEEGLLLWCTEAPVHRTLHLGQGPGMLYMTLQTKLFHSGPVFTSLVFSVQGKSFIQQVFAKYLQSAGHHK